MPSSKFGTEHQAREFKACLLASFLQKYTFTIDLARRLDDDGWNKVAACARINPPSATTQKMALAEFEKRETAKRATFHRRLMDLEVRTRPETKTTSKPAGRKPAKKGTR